jgi:hypothetical protein
MAYNELALLVDVNGRPIPQYYDVVNDEFKPLGTMPMQDAAVKEELELLKAELETIKANQTSGDQKVQLSGNIAELSSAQHSESATTVKTYARAAGAARIEVYVESGRVRIRTDGQPCTAVTGEPLGEGFGAAWAVPSISLLFVDDSVITVVSR